MPTPPVTKAPVKKTTTTTTQKKPVAGVPAAARKPAVQKVPTPPKSQNWLNRTVQGYVGGAGDYAGGLIYGVGNGVNKVGEGIGASITNTTRGWGQGVAGYGNNIKDVVNASGPRVATAGNPLALAGAGSAKGSPAASQKTVTRKGTTANPLGL